MGANRTFHFEMSGRPLATALLPSLDAAERHAFALGCDEAQRRNVSAVEIDVRNSNRMRVLVVKARR